MSNNTYFSSQKYFSIFWLFFFSKSSISLKFMVTKWEGNNSVWEVKSLVVKLREFCFNNSFFYHFSLKDSELRHFFVIGWWFLKVSKLTNDLILLVKFPKFIPLEPFLMPLRFLFDFQFLNISKYSFGLTARVTNHGLLIFSVS